jgi:hypothetical protein
MGLTHTKLRIVRGDDWTYNLAFYSDTAHTATINITGWTVFFTVKQHKTDTDAQASLSKTITTHVTPTTGKSKITLTNIDTNLLNGNYYFDIQVKKSDGIVQTVTIGEIEFTTDITRRIV